jgi:NAD(P)-dependent dehydrogenase (short-subunit alcohol dehydrogenase family)
MERRDSMQQSTHKTFLITGVSSGFGRAFAQAALDAGHTVIGTVRKPDACAEFERLALGRAHAVELDVANFERVEPVIAQALQQYGPVDVLINNAGYGHEGTLEESPLAEMRRQFDVNVFGAVAVTKAVLPSMRVRRKGHIVNITSMGGFITLPGIAYYCGSKFALEGISEVLAKEVAQFNVYVTAVAPGSFRTDWAGRSMVRSARSVSDYDALFDPVRAAREAKSGQQAGDPVKAAQVVLKLVETEHPPVHLVLGSDALKLVSEKLVAMQEEVAAWREVSRSTDFSA